MILRVDGRPVLLSEYAARDYALLKKSVGDKTRRRAGPRRRRAGPLVEGPPHTLTYFSASGEFRQRTVKIHGNVLLWTHGPVTVRLEGRISKAQALRARSPNRLTDPPSGGDPQSRSAPNTR